MRHYQQHMGGIMAEVDEVKTKPNKDAISMLEEMLELAKAGKVLSVAIAYASPDAQTGNCFVVPNRGVALLGELQILHRDVMDCYGGLIRRSPSWEFCE